MTHSRPRTFSPSSRRITRSTPCVAGCCGPMLMTSSLASRKVLSWLSSSSGESVVLGSVISILTARFLLPAFDAQVDLHPLVVLLQDAVILAQGMSLPAVGKQDAFHVGMPVKLDAEHVIHFALQPVRPWPDRNRTGQGRAVEDLRFHADAFIAREGIKHPDDIELLLARGVMHGGDVHAIIELLFVAENLKNFGNHRAVNDHVILPPVSQRLDAGTVVAFELGDHGRIPGS